MRLSRTPAPGEKPPAHNNVFDCVVYLQAAINACLSLVESGRVKLLASPAILAEVRDVLSRDKLRKKFPHLTDARVEQFLSTLAILRSCCPMFRPYSHFNAILTTRCTLTSQLPLEPNSSSAGTTIFST
jgi:hypothetical protein